MAARMVQRIIALLVLAWLGACSSTYSIQPLMDAGDGKAIFGQQVSALLYEKNGKLTLNSKGAAEPVSLKFSGGQYRVDNMLVSFHPIPSSESLHLVQVVTKGKSRTVYGIGRAFGEKQYAIDNFVLDKLTVAAAKENQISIKHKEDDTQVLDVNSLRDLAGLYTQINARKLRKAANFEMMARLAFDQDEQTALLTLASEISCLTAAGHPLDPAIRKLPKKFSRGIPINRIDASHASKYCNIAVQSGNNRSVAYASARVDYRNKRYANAHKKLEPLMAEKFALAYVLKADLARQGLGVKKSARQALKYLKQAAEISEVGRLNLGVFLQHGLLGKPDYAGARREYQTILDTQDYPPAQAAMAYLMERGLGGPKNMTAAADLYRAAAANNNPNGQLGLGKLHYFGKSLPKDHKQAYRQLKLAADYGLHEAQYFVGFMATRGQGTKKNEKRARRYFSMAIALGHNESRAELGRLMARGLGGKTDLAGGRKLLEQASANGSKNAKKYLASLEQPNRPSNPASSSTSQSRPGNNPSMRSARHYKGVPTAHQSELTGLLNKRSFKLSTQNQAFFGGLGSGMLRQCGVPRDAATKTKMQKFVMTTANGSLLGTNYSSRNLSESIGSSAQHQALFAAGIKVGEQIPCTVASSASVQLVSAIERTNRGPDGGPSAFVKTCTPAFDQRRCQCLANTGRTVMPDIHQRFYRPRLIKEIISRNPFIGLQIGISCGISNY